MSFTIVLLDGKERQNVSLEELKDLFFKRQINQNSLISSPQNPQWQMLKRSFDLSQWIPSQASFNNLPVNSSIDAPPVNPFAPNYGNQPASDYQPTNPVGYQNPFLKAQNVPQNSFEQPVANHSGEPFNQLSQSQNQTANQFNAPSSTHGYSQNNQSETYYQAETSQTNYNFKNTQTSYSQSNYGNQPNSAHYSPSYPQNSAEESGNRNGLRQAAVFLILNALFYVAYLFLGSVFAPEANHNADYNSGKATGLFLPIIIDLWLAAKLWKGVNAESARKRVLVRSYFGFAIFGIIIPLLSFSSGNFFIGIFSFVTTFFLFVSLALTLHGKVSPSSSRVMIGVGTFAVYFLVMFGIIALAFVGKLAPNMAKFKFPQNSELQKYKVEGKEFQDKTNGAKVVLPDGWAMISLDNPVVHTPEARMIAIDEAGNRLTMLEVVPVPGNLDMKRQNPSFVLDKIADGVVVGLKKQTESEKAGFGEKNSFNEITRLSIYVGTHPARLLIFDKTIGGVKAKGHLIITYDELTFYVLHSWCPAEEYEQAQTDFTFFEKNFTVPEKISSSFTQSAETQEIKNDPKKNF